MIIIKLERENYLEEGTIVNQYLLPDNQIKSIPKSQVVQSVEAFLSLPGILLGIPDRTSFVICDNNDMVVGVCVEIIYNTLSTILEPNQSRFNERVITGLLATQIGIPKVNVKPMLSSYIVEVLKKRDLICQDTEGFYTIKKINEMKSFVAAIK